MSGLASLNEVDTWTVQDIFKAIAMLDLKEDQIYLSNNPQPEREIIGK